MRYNRTFFLLWLPVCVIIIVMIATFLSFLEMLMSARLPQTLFATAFLVLSLSMCTSNVDGAANEHGALKSYVESCAQKVFSEGLFDRPDGRIHRFVDPINLEIIFPECESEALEAARVFRKKIGIHIHLAGEGESRVHVTWLIMGINSVDDLAKDERWYAWLSSNVFKGDVDTFDSVNKTNYNKFVLVKDFVDSNYQIVFALDILNNDTIRSVGCGKILSQILFTHMANSFVIPKSGYLSDFDYLFVSSLYDKSILPNEDEESASPKIVKILLNALEGKNNGQ